ncbi:Protein MIS12-like isoform B [Glycine soja]|uniref:Protein MIS12-like isoform B n=1 Tax=Glycine soja TaxID=3848 RepID=A0A445KIS7_GLYSO|nr:Protein MIS12-like isoform B [Glycine soja]
MEGSESEAVFGALYLNPQLFCNEVLNIIDDVLQEAFNFFFQDASRKLNIESTQRSQLLKKGVDCVRQRVQSVLDKKLATWESYILRHCFALPQGFRVPNTDDANENALDSGAPFDPDIDAQLDSLREKLIEVGKESEMLNQEIQALERKSIVNAAGHINEAVQLYEQNSMHEVFQGDTPISNCICVSKQLYVAFYVQFDEAKEHRMLRIHTVDIFKLLIPIEIVTTASELGTKMGKLNSSMIEETDQTKTKRIYSTQMDPSAINPVKGLSNMKLDDVEEFCKCYEEYVNLSFSSI